MSLFIGQSSQAANPTWVGSAGSTDWNTSANFSPVASAGSALVFTGANASSSATLTNTFASGTSFAGITFNAGALAYTMTGNSINLTAGIVNNGTNLETFSETGGITNSVGSTFFVNSSGGGVSLTTGLTDSSNASQTTTVNGTGGTLTLSSFTLNSGAATINDSFNGGGNVSITGAVTNGGAGVNGLTYSGTGMLILSGAGNTYTGGTTVTSGTVLVTGSGTLGATTGALAVNAGTLNLGTTSQTVGAVTLTGAGTIANGGLTGTSYAVSNTTGTSTISANLAGSGTLGETGGTGGTLLLSGTNSYSGATTINSGTLDFATENSLYSNTTGSWTTAKVIVKNGGTAAFGVGANGSGYFTSTDIGTLLTNLDGPNTTGGLLAGSAIGFDTTNASGGTFTLSNNIVNTTGSGGGAVGLAKLGAGTLVLSGAGNTYTGTTTVTAGTLQIATGSTLGAATAPLSVGAGTLNLGGTSQTVGAVTMTGAGTIANGTLTGASYTDTSTSGVGTISANLGGSGTLNENGAGGTLVLSGANTYSGATTVTAGTLNFANENALYNNTTGSWTAAKIIVKSGAAAVFSVGANGSGYFTNSDLNTLLPALEAGGTAGGLASGSAIGFDTSNAAGTFTISNAITNSTGSGGGAVGLQKLGSGTLDLAGANTYTGPSTFIGGSVVLDYTGSGTRISGTGTGGVLTLGSNLILSGGSNKVESVTSTTFAPNYESNITASAGSGDSINLGALTFGANASANLMPGVAFSTSQSGTSTAAYGAYNSGSYGTLDGAWATVGNGSTSVDFATTSTFTNGTSNQIVALPTYGYAVFTGTSGNSQGNSLTPNAAGVTNNNTGAGNYGPWKIDASNSTAAGSFNINRSGAGANFFVTTSILYTGFDNYSITGNPIFQNQGGSSANTGFMNFGTYGTGTLTIGSSIYGNIYETSVVSNAFTGVYTAAQGANGNAVAGNLNKTGPGTLVLAGTNNYVGNTEISEGTLSIGSDSNLGGVSGLLTLVNSTAGSTTVTVSATGFPTSLTLTGASFLGSTITSQGAAANGNVILTLASGANVTATSGSYGYANGQQNLLIDGTLKATNTFTLGEAATGGAGGTVANYRSISLGANGGTIDVTGSNTLTAPGVISPLVASGTLNTVALTKTDSGTLVLAGANTYTGGTIVNGGTVKLDFAATGVSGFTSPTSNILASAGGLTLGGGTLSVNGAGTAVANTQTISNLTLSGGSNAIALTQNSASSVGLTFTNGTIARTLGSTIDFNPATGTSVTLAGNANNAFLGNYAFYGTGATQGYAATGTSGVVQAAATSAATTASNFTSNTTNYTYGGAGGGTDSTISAGGNATANTVAFATTAPETIALGTNTLTLNGFLNNGGALTINGGSVAVGSSNELVIGGSTNVNISSAITGASGALTDSNTGTVALSGVNTYAGPTTVNSGTLALTGGSLTGSNVTTAGTGVVTQSAGNVIAGNGTTFTQGSTGTSTLAGTNTYTGLTTVGNGELDLNNTGGQAIAGNLAVSGGAAVLLQSNQINTASSVAVTGGTLNVQGFNQTLAGVQLNGGTIAGSGGTLTSNSAFDVENGVATAILGGSNGLNKTTTGVVLLSGANTYTGTTTIGNGTVYISNQNNLGASTSAIVLGSATTSGLLSYTGASGNFTRGFTVNAGGGEIDSGVATLTITSGNNITTNGTITFGGVGSTAVNSVIGGGTGGLTASLDGTLTLAGLNTYTGATTLNAGVTSVSNVVVTGGASNLGNATSAVALNNNADLSYTGNNATFTRGFTVGATGGEIDTATAGKVLTIATGNIVNSTGATTFGGLGNTTVTSVIGGGAGGVTKIGTGTLTLSGANTYTGATSVNQGTLIATSASALGATSGATENVTVAISGASYAGGALNYAASSDTQLAIGGAMTINGGATTSIGGSIGASTTSSEILVTGKGTASGAIKVNIFGETGITPTTGTYNLVLSNTGTSTFGGGTYTLGTVYNDTNFTVGTPTATATAIQVGITSATALTNAYWIGGFSGGNNVWAASNGGNGSPVSNWSTTLGSVTNTGLVPGASTNVFISDTGFITTAPTATVLGTNMTIGSLTIQDAVNAFALTADGNTLTIGTSAGITQISGAKASNIAANVALGASQTWTNNSANTLTVSGPVSGAFALTTAGTGTTVLSGANTYSGGTNINGGTLSLGSTGALGTTGTISFGGGTLQFSSNNTTDYTGRFSTAASQAYSFDTNGQTVTFATALTSANGSLTLKDSAGTGTLILADNNTFTGGVTINSGTLQLGNAGALNSTAGSQNGVTFGASSTGVLALAGNSVTIASLNSSTPAGTSKVENANGAAVSNATLTVGNSGNANGTYAGTIQDGTGGGTLALTKTGSGTLSLSGANTYTGATTVNAGTLALTGGSLTGSNVTTTGSGVVTQSTGNVIAGSGVTFTQGSTGTSTLAGANTFTGGVTINAGTLQLGSTGALNSTAGSQNAVTFGSASTGTLALNGNNATVGSLTTNATPGTTVVENSDGSSVANATLTVGNSNNLSGTYAGTVQDGSGGGTLALTKAGLGTLTLTGTNSYSGGTTISAGTLAISNSNALSNGTITLNGGALAATSAVALSNNIVSNFGARAFVSGSNTITSNGNLTFNGTTGTPSVFINNMTGGASFVETGTTSLANNNSAIGEVIFGGSGNTSLDTIYAGPSGNTTIASLLNYYGTGTLTLNGLNFTSGTLNFLGGTVVANENGDGAGYLLGAGSNLLVLGSNLVLSGGNGIQENVNGFGVATNTGVSNAASISAAAGSGDTINLGSIGDGNGLGVANFQPGVAFTTTGSGAQGTSGLGNTGTYGGWALAGNGVTEDFAANLQTTGNNAAIVALPTYDYSIIGRNTAYVELVANLGGQSVVDGGDANWTSIKFDSSNSTATGTYTVNRPSVLANFFGSENLLFTGAGNITTSGNAMVQELNLDGNDNGLIYLQQYGTGTVTISNNLYGATSIGAVTTGGAVSEAYGNAFGNLIKSGPGTVVLTGTNNYVGNTYVDGGTLSIGSDSNLGGLAGSLTVTAATSSSNTVTVTGVPISQTLVGASFLGTTITSQTVSSTPGVAGGTVTLTLAAPVSAATGTFSYANGQQNIELNGGTLQATASFVLGESNGTVSNNRTISLGANGGTIDVTGSNTLTVGGVISGAGGTGTLANGTLTKTDSGTLVLAAANTNAGGTFVNGGTLKLDFGATGLTNFTSPTSNILASTGSLTLGGGTLSVNGAGTAVANTQTVASLALSGGSNTIALTQNSATSVGLTVTNGNNVTRVTGSTIDFNPGTGTSVTLAGNTNNSFLGNYAFFGTGATEGYAATSSTGVVQAAATTAATTASNFNSAATNYTYGGAGGTTDSSISTGGNATANTVAFATTAPETIALGANTLTLNGFLNNGGALTISGGTVAVGSSNELVLGGASNVNISSAITGAGGALTDSNSGTVALSGVNTYTGPTTVNTGTLALTGGSLTGSNVTTAGTGVVTQSAGNVIAGTGTTFTQGSTGTSTLAGSNTYSGLTTVSNGELDLNNTGGQSIAGNLAVTGGTAKLLQGSQVNTASSLAVSSGTFNVQGFNQTLAGVQLTGGTIAGSGGTLTSNSAFDVQNGVVSAILGGSAGLTKSTGGVVLLSGANTYTGTTAINGGIVEISALNNLGADTSAVSLGGGTLSYTGSSAANFTRGFTMTANSEIDSSAAGALTVSTGAITGDVQTLTVGGTGSTNISSNITTTSGGLNVNQFGTLTLAGTNTFAGLTTINNGTLNLGSAGALGGGGNITFNGGTLQFSANNTSDVSGRIVNSTAVGPISIDTNGQSVLFASALDGSNLDGLNKLGAGTLTLSGANGYAGNTVISGGTLEFTAPTAMTASGTVTANNGTTLAIAVGGSGQFTNGTSGAGTIGGIFSNTGGQGAGVTLNSGSAVGIDTTGGSVTYSGNITNAGVGLTKLGSNTLTLAGANTYTGPTTINAGALAVSGSTAAGSAVTINTGGSLVGDSAVNEGTLNGSVTMNAGGAINLQDGTIGTLHLGSIALNGGTLSFDVGSGSSGNLDLIASAGTLTVGGNTQITIGFVSGTTTLTAGTYSLLTYGGTALTTANFNKLSLSSTTLGSYSLSLVNGATGTSGVELKISASTSPTTYTLSTTAAATRILVGHSTNLTTTITNSGSAGQDTLSYTGLGSSSTGVTGSTTSSGTPLAVGASGQNTVQSFTGSTTGNQTISPTVGTATNGTLGGSATLSGTPGTATVDVVALRTINNGAATNLGTLHSGASVSGTANAFTSTGTVTTTTSVQVAGGNGTADSNGVTLAGSSTTFNGATAGSVNGSTQTFGGTITNASGGTTTGSFILAATTLETGLGDTYAPVTVGYTANVFTGKSTWNSSSSGAWGTITGTTPDSAFTSNWTASGGAPGVTAGFTGVDTATFGAQTSAPVTVSLNNAAPNLNSITFSSPTTAYTLAQGSGSNSITLSGTTPSINVTTNATAGTQTISAPVILGATTALNVGGNQTLNVSGAISGSGFGLTNIGSGATILSNLAGNTYTGGTTINAGKVYVNNTSGSGTGSGAVTVNGGQLLGSGIITTSSGVTINGGGSLASGLAQSSTSKAVDGTHLTFNNTAVTVGSLTGTANLTFDLGTGNSGINGGNASGTFDFSNPNNNTTYLSLTGSSSINFAGTTSLSIVDLTNTTGSNGSLALRLASPYLLIHAGSNADYLNLVVNIGTAANPIYTLSQNDAGLNGFVMGVWAGGSNPLTDYTAIAITEYGSDGVTPLTSTPGGIYYAPALYLDGGNFEVVPEPGTWALMLGGVALLLVIQRRRNKV